MSFSLLSVCLCASGSTHLNFAFISFLCPGKKIGSDWFKPADRRECEEIRRNWLVVSFPPFLFTILHIFPFPGREWLIWSWVKYKAAPFTHQEIYTIPAKYIVVILTLEERTKNTLSGSYSWDKCGKFLTPYVLIPVFDVLFSNSNETSSLEFEKLDSLTKSCVTSERLIPHTLPFKGWLVSSHSETGTWAFNCLQRWALSTQLFVSRSDSGPTVGKWVVVVVSVLKAGEFAAKYVFTRTVYHKRVQMLVC